MPPVESISRSERTAATLAHQYVERPRRGACRHDYRPAPLHAGLGQTARRLAHEQRHHALESHFQLRRHASPVGRSADNQYVGRGDLFGYRVRIVVRQRAYAALATLHAARAGADVAVV